MTYAVNAIPGSPLRRSVAFALLFCLLTLTASAQTSSDTDGTTPLALAPGSPAGSFALSGFDNINPYNGGLNFHLPLAGIGGRGGAGYTMMLPIENKWHVQADKINLNTTLYHAIFNWWTSIKPGYGPGVLVGRSVGRLGPQDCQEAYDSMLTRLTFIRPDGTEYELRDELYDGEPSPNRPPLSPCQGTSLNRGRVFKTSDGTSVTFIADNPIVDDTSGTILDNGESIVTAAGNLYMPDGTLYRINSSGLVEYIRDRNGNKVSFQYDTFSRVTLITNSLNQTVTVCYASTASCGNNIYDLITFKGFGGAQRNIKVYYNSNYNNILRNTQPGDYPPPNPLFPELNGTGVLGSFRVVSAVELPDGRTYQFQYSAYGELARVVLPTGGVYEYDHQAGVNNAATSGVIWPVGYNIYRRVVAKRVYRDTSLSSLESRMTFSKPETCTSGSPNCTGVSTTGYVTVNHYDAISPTPIASETHYYYGASFYSFLRKPWEYSGWKDGKEYQADTGVSVLRREVDTWEQRAPVSWWGLPTDPPPQDPRIAETVTTLVDANMVSKQTFSYDQYNNQTDVYEYGFGPGAPGPLIRRTHTPYLTTNGNQGNVDYAADNNIHIRNLPVQKIVYDDSGNERSQTDFIYDYYGDFPLADCPGIVQHDGGFNTGYGTRGNLTEVILRNPDRQQGDPIAEIYLRNQYDIAGNLVKAVDGRTPAGITTFDYSDRFGAPDDEAQSNAGAPELAGGFSYAFPTKVTNALGHTTYTQYDYYLGRGVNSEGPNGVISSIAYNDALDRPTQGIQARYKVGVGVPAERRQMTVTYDDTNHVITTTADCDALNDSILTGNSYYDGLGRTWRSAGYEGSTWTIKDTHFDALGRVSQVSNPYRAADPGSAAPPSGLWTTTDYDALGRVIKVTTPDGAHVDTAYSGNQVTVTDQAGKLRRTETDAVGRLIKVTEDQDGLNYDTSYLYDVLGNLRKVTQGTQIRLFAYDSLSRLIRVKSPEQNTNGSLPAYTDPVTGGSGWAMAYKYDENGNLKEKTDARGVVATYSYDALNRNTGIDYINGSQTRSVERVYDGAANGKGRLHYERTKEGGVDATQTWIDSYDALGRPLNQQQSFWRGSEWGTPYVVQQTYNLAGNVKTLTYPSGRIVNYGYDQAGRLNSFTGNLGDGVNRNYATGMQYDAAGSMKREQFGTTIPLYHRRHYNNREQLFDIRLGTDPNPSYDSDDLNAWQNAAGSLNRGALKLYYSTIDVCHVYGNGGTNNNGNLLRMDHQVPVDDAVSNFVASIDRYDYDPLNRIKSVTELSYTKGPSGDDIYQGVFRQAFLYDRGGNRTIDQANTIGGVNNKAYTVDAATNRLTSVDGVAMSYDAAGNQTNDGSGQRTYDGENRMVEAYNSSGVRVSWYVYDAEGRRVVRTVGSQGTWQIYGIGGELLAEYAVGAAPSAPQKEYGCRNGQLLVVWDGSEAGDRQLQWLVQDHLGSTRMVVDRSGGLAGVKRHDYLPFGEELSAGVGIRSASNGYSGDLVRQKYDAYERDSETGLDFAQARYYANVQGRFTSTDRLYFQAGMAIDPQRFNLYAFARNNPLKWSDPTGEALYLRGNINWLSTNVLYELAGGQEEFERYFHVENGQVLLNDDVHLDEDANAGLQEIYSLVTSTENYLYYAGTNGEEAALLFEGSGSEGHLTQSGRDRARAFTGEGRQTGAGTLVGTRGREHQIQPANLANGDPVFAVIAYNTNVVMTETSVNYGALDPVRPEVRAEQEAGLGQVVRPVSFFIHETAENQTFAFQGVPAGRPADYGRAHAMAMIYEADIRRDLHITGGFAGAGLETRVPRR